MATVQTLCNNIPTFAYCIPLWSWNAATENKPSSFFLSRPYPSEPLYLKWQQVRVRLSVINKRCCTLFKHHIANKQVLLLSNSCVCRSHWLRGLRSRSADARLLGLRVRIPPWEWVLVSFECFVLSEVSVSGWSLIQRSPIECGVSECDRESSTMRSPWSTRSCYTEKKIRQTSSVYDCTVGDVEYVAAILLLS